MSAKGYVQQIVRFWHDILQRSNAKMHAKNLLFHRIMLPRVETRGYLHLTHVAGHFFKYNGLSLVMFIEFRNICQVSLA